MIARIGSFQVRNQANVEKNRLAPERAVQGKSLESVVAQENGWSFLIRPGQGPSEFYLDMCDTQAWLAGQVRGTTVLNLFSYICGFGVAATAGEARRVLNLDASHRVLKIGEENARLNGHLVEHYDYVAGDVLD